MELKEGVQLWNKAREVIPRVRDGMEFENGAKLRVGEVDKWRVLLGSRLRSWCSISHEKSSRWEQKWKGRQWPGCVQS